MKNDVFAVTARFKISVICLPLALIACSQSSPPDSALQLEQSRAIVKDFAGQLQAELTGAMQSGGPVRAIAVCQERAPAIAQELSELHGAIVMRTSVQWRNPNSAPSPWQRNALQTFDARLNADNDPAEYFDGSHQDGARYMKPIYTQPLCLACHGEALGAAVTEALDQHYPKDLATGYAAGDLRGAFSIQWPPDK